MNQFSRESSASPPNMATTEDEASSTGALVIGRARRRLEVEPARLDPAGQFTARHVGKFEDLLSVFVKKFGGMKSVKASLLVDRANELSKGVAQAHDWIGQHFVPEAKISGSGRPKIVIETILTHRGNLSLRMMEPSRYGREIANPRSMDMETGAINEVLHMWKAKDFFGISMLRRDEDENPYGAYKKDLIELVLAAHGAIYAAAEAVFDVTVGRAPFGRFHTDGSLEFGLENAERLVFKEKAAYAAADKDVVNDVLYAFLSTFPNTNPARFVCLYDRRFRAYNTADSLKSSFADIGVEFTSDDGPIVVEGSHEFRVNLKSLDDAAHLMERSLDIVKPNWKMNFLFGDLWPVRIADGDPDTGQEPVEANTELDEVPRPRF